MPDPLVLAFDTSAAHCAAALLSGDRVLASRIEAMPKGQVERLMPLLEDVCAEADLTVADLDGLGVGVGPGNFTGIRISVAAARGLAMARKIPVAGVPVLDAMALDAGFSVVATEAPRGLLFSQFTGSAPVQSTFEDMPLPPAGTTAQVIGFRAGDIAERIGGVVRAPLYSLPEAIARAAMRMIQSGDVPLPVPLYIRPADAAPARDKPPVMLD